MKEEGGFFLLETIVTALLLVSAIGIFAVYEGAGRWHYYQEAEMTAAFFAREMLARQEGELRIGGDQPPAEKIYEKELNRKRYTGKVTAEDTDLPRVKVLRATVSWTDGWRQNKFSLQKMVKI